MKLKVTMAQIQVRTGDLDGNTKRILNAIDTAIEQNADIVVFPETSIKGYACADIFLDNGFKTPQLEFVEKIIGP